MKENKKSSKGLTILIIILIIYVIGLGGYIVYDKVLNKNKQTANNSNIPSTTKKIENYDENIKKLENELITNDKSMGLYFDKKVSIEDSSNADFIIYNLKKYLLENNINYTNSDYKCGSPTGDDNYYSYDTLQEVKKDDLNEFIKNKYNSKKNYILNSQNELFDFNSASDMVLVTNDNYRIICEARSGSIKTFYNSLTNYEKKQNEIIIYDKVILCETNGGAISCKSNNNEKFSCSYDNDDCTNLDQKILKLFEEDNEIQRYKHIFKIFNGNYYWYSSEPINN